MIKLEDIGSIGSHLNRPECVLTHQSGLLFTSDWTDNGGISIISTNGNVQRILSRENTFTVRPNGVAIEPSGSFLLAHLGNDDGGIYRLHPDGALEDLITEVDGKPLPPSNYIHLDQQGRSWITISTRKIPRADAYRQDIADGFIVLIDKHGCKVVADDLGYTNECLVHPDGQRLFVNETFSRRLTCFDIEANGNLSNRRTICEFDAGTYPDGMTFDTSGGIWITSIISNRVIRVQEDGSQQIIVEDLDPEHINIVEAAFQANELGRPHLDKAKSKQLKNISSLAFGGHDLRTAYLGCLLGDHIAYFKTPYSGVAPVHWDAPLNKLQAFLKPAQ